MSTRPTIDEVFPILATIKDVPLEVCKAAYDKFDNNSPGWQIDVLNACAPRGSTRDFIEYLYPGMEFGKWEAHHYRDFALAIEYANRIGKLK